jgi:predicted permease
MRTLVSEFRRACRSLVGTPGFTAIAVLILGVGIGLNTAVFSVANMAILRPLPGESRPGRLAALYAFDRTRPDSYREFSYAAYADIRDRGRAFSEVAGLAVTMVGLGEGEMTRRGFAFIATSTLFSLFDARPTLGRAFLPEEETPGAERLVAIVSDEYWRRSGADPGIVGRTIRINTRLFTVIGVAPRGFGGPSTLVTPAVWLPTGAYDVLAGATSSQGPRRRFADRAEESMMLYTRVRPGLTYESAQAALAPLARELERTFPAEHRNLALQLLPISRTGIGTGPQNDRQALGVLALVQGMTAVVLAVACMNLANMLLARSTTRRREIAVRFALGANRADVVRQLLTEGFVLALAGSAAGLLFTFWALRGIAASLDPLAELMIAIDPAPDLRILAVALGCAVGATLLFSAGPAVRLVRTDVFSDLKEGARTEDTGRRRYLSLRHVLVVGQVALSLALLTAAGLFVRGAARAARAEPGFPLEGNLIVGVDPSLTPLGEVTIRDFYRRALERVRATPGVQAASLASIVPFGNLSETRRVRAAGQDVADRVTDNQTGGASVSYGAGDTDAGRDDRNGVSSAFYVVGADYFETLRVPLLRGRTFSAGEETGKTGPRVAVIDQSLAARLFKGTEPVGASIYVPDPDEEVRAPMQVVGVVAGTRHSLADTSPVPHVFVPYGQWFRPTMTIHARVERQGAASDAATLAAIRSQIRAVDAAIPIVVSNNMSDFRDHGMAAWGVRFGARMFAIFGVVAAFLAIVGLYGVRAYLVACRTREIGVRMALGATGADVMRMVIREGMVLVAVGVATGVPLAFAAGAGLQGMIYEVSGHDPASFVGAALLLSLSALVACYVPARRATRVSPTEALRAS